MKPVAIRPDPIMKKRVTIYWLVPAKPESELFRDIIRILAKEFNGPLFQPHLTLCRSEDRSSPRTVLSQVRVLSVQLRIREIAHSAKFTKTLFVRFAPSRRLQLVVTELGGKTRSVSDPHLSLLYKKSPAAIRRELAATINLPMAEVRFDAITAMRCVLPTKTKQDVETWRKLATKRLSG